MTSENSLPPETLVTKTLYELRIGSKIIRLKTIKGSLPPIYRDDDGVLRTSVWTGPSQRTRFMLDVDERTP